MGDFIVEGVGVFEIKGDVPTPEEARAIAEIIGVPEEAPAPSPRRLKESAAPIPEPPTEVPSELFGKPERPGPLGLLPAQERGRIREAVEGQPGLSQLLIEMGPSIAGGIEGGLLGFAAGGPPGAFIGAGIGAAGMELAAQETGLAPTSATNLALAGAGPATGAAIGKGAQLAKRGAGFLVTKAPFARAARVANVLGGAVDEFEKLGTRILEKQKGLMKRPASELFAMVRRTKIGIPATKLRKTLSAVTELQDEMQRFASFPEVREATGLLDSIRTSITQDGGILLGDLVTLRSLVGVAVKRAESARGIKLGSAKKAFQAIANDMDAIAAGKVGATARQTRLAKVAIARAKLGFGVDEMEEVVAKFISTTDEGTVLNAKGLLNELIDISNPKSAKFNKNLTDALKDELPAIKDRLTELVKIGKPGSPGGPGSIVVRGQTARLGRGVIGGLIGGGITGDVLGAGAGAIAGASLPEMIVAGLTTKTGAAFLEAAAKAGRGQINQQAWQVFGLILLRSAGEGEAAAASRELRDEDITRFQERMTERFQGEVPVQ